MERATMFLSNLILEAATYSVWSKDDLNAETEGSAKYKAINARLGRPKSIMVGVATPEGVNAQAAAILRRCGLKDKAVYWEGTMPASRFAEFREDMELFGASFKRTNRAAPAKRTTAPSEDDLFSGM